ncbi:serine/threonine-protein kinase [Pseudomarimonas salicorniae]|uniref:Serine/threonine-protein kinase n=1 Tax=Pseudomarimonas salicorniae TaxID=2933270 RepID=A0ABT0GI89_9GAMM|nr:serine/threonine-protein kinase [Lysobacter sp. CAU 1642]MCK7593727.1 serine/threonine-protein kinase [Lysobacter sp. CAU 1642]
MQDITQVSDKIPEPSRFQDLPGSSVGGYLLLSVLGEGGFGVVFEAEQSKPIQRRVALKLIKRGMGAHEFVQRFEAERQTLALMDHPHIARVLDAGSSEDGRPFLVMELVEGSAITEFCDQQRLDVHARLSLFVQVCEAIQHAHGKGIIHRDLKPNNVLVSLQDGRPFAKVIDFGIAKALGARSAADGAQTAIGMLIGTPAYMSPEQAAGSRDIDTRSDIYALGVMLYELLTYNTPLDVETLRDANVFEIQRIISEVEPLSPSNRLSGDHDSLAGISGHGRLAPDQLRRLLRGELDWIVMKAIDKDRTRRYETASEFAADIRRFLAGRPVLAAPPSAGYRLRKFMRRHAIAVGAAALLLLALTGGVAGIAWQARIAGERAAQLAEMVAFDQEIFSRIDPASAGGQLSQDVLTAYAETLQDSMPHSPEQRAAALAAFEEAWQSINATDRARRLIDSTILQPAVAASEERFGGRPALKADLLLTLAERYAAFGQQETSLELVRDALTARREALGEDHSETLSARADLGRLQFQTGRLATAERTLRSVLAGFRRLLGEHDRETLSVLADLGSVLQERGQHGEAERLIRRAHALRHEHLGPSDPDTLQSLNDLALLLQADGQLEEAEQRLRQALQDYRERFDDEDPNVLALLGNLAGVLQDMGQLDEAETMFRKQLENERRLLGEQHPDTLTSLNNLAILLHERGKDEEAVRMLSSTLENQKRILGSQHPATLNTLSNLAIIEHDRGRPAVALPLAAQALRISRSLYGNAHPSTLSLIGDVGGLHHELDQLGPAIAYLQEAWERRRALHGAADPDALVAALNYSRALNDAGRSAEAQALLGPLEDALRDHFAELDATRIGQWLTETARADLAAGRFSAAEAALLKARQILEPLAAESPRSTADNLLALEALYTEWNRLQPTPRQAGQAAHWRAERQAMTE